MSDHFFIRFTKGDDGSVLVFPFGKFYRDGAERQFTPEMGKQMVAHFKDNVIERKNGWLPVNREHVRKDGRIAYITDLFMSEDGVRGRLQAADGYEGALGAFDYISPEVRWKWVHPKTNQEYTNVLFGAGATNYPFFLGPMALHSEEALGFSLSWEWEEDDWTPVDPFAESREQLQKAREGRAKRYEIAAKKDGHLTPPKGYPTSESEYGDPVNYRYPCDRLRALAAVGYYNQSKNRAAGGYSTEEWATVGRRIARLAGTQMKVSYQYKDGRVVRKENEKANDPVTEPFTHVTEFVTADDARRVVMGVVLQPDVLDAQGHFVSAEEIEVACHRFTANLQAKDLDEQHRRLVQSDEAHVVESWIQREPVVWRYGDKETQILPGSWCLAVKVVSDDLWEDVLSGEITGFSPRGTALAQAL